MKVQSKKTNTLSNRAGFPREISPNVDTEDRPLSMAWMTDDLLAETQAAWSEAYGRSVSKTEAIEILMNLRRLADLLMNVARKETIET